MQSTPLGKWHSDGHQICQYRLDDEGKVKTFTKLSKLQGIDFDSTRKRVLGAKTKYPREQAQSQHKNLLDVIDGDTKNGPKMN